MLTQDDMGLSGCDSGASSSVSNFGQENKQNEGEAQQQEGESNDKFLRRQIEILMYNTKTGIWIENIISMVSLVSSVAFVVLTYWDHSKTNACCIG